MFSTRVIRSLTLASCERFKGRYCDEVVAFVAFRFCPYAGHACMLGGVMLMTTVAAQGYAG